MKFKLFYIVLFVCSISFGQTITSEEILIQNDSIELPGTLTFTKEKAPLVIWIHGSGNIDRNGNQGNIIKANYIKQIRDEVNKKDIAFFSYDKRTATAKNIKFIKGIVYEDLVDDAKKVVAHFKNDKRFSEIILIGHSQGSLTAILASKNISKYISIAGPATSIDKTIIQQITNQSAEFGKVAEAHFKELFDTGDIKQVNPLLASVFAKQNLPFIKSWAAYEPAKEIQKINIPTLIINGTLDSQVKVDDAKALHQAYPKGELMIIEKMNHVLKHLEKESDNMNSYYSADFPISKKLITTIVNFILY